MELLDMLRNRRSVRTYTGEPVAQEKLDKILEAGLLSPSGRAVYPWEFIVVREKEVLEKLAESRPSGGGMLRGADCAVVVIADGERTDVWAEDCSIAMAYMHLMADSLGVGSCWIQGRLREAADGRPMEDYVRELLGYPEGYRLEAILSLGMPAVHPGPRSEKELLREKIHWGTF